MIVQSIAITLMVDILIIAVTVIAKKIADSIQFWFYFSVALHSIIRVIYKVLCSDFKKGYFCLSKLVYLNVAELDKCKYESM